MGLNFPAIKTLIESGLFVRGTDGKRLLEIGRLKNSLSFWQIDYLNKRYGLPLDVMKGSASQIYEYFGFSEITALDNSDFEGANLNHNLNIPPYNSSDTLSKYEGIFDLVIDGGTSEHVYSPIASLTNYLYLCKNSGSVVQMLPINNYVDHGIYQFSPTFFHSIKLNNLLLTHLSFFEHGPQGKKNRQWNGLDPEFREHIHGAWDGSAYANLFRFTSKNIVGGAVWRKFNHLDYENLLINSQQEVYRAQWENNQILSTKQISNKTKKLLLFVYLNHNSPYSRLIANFMLNRRSSK